MSADEDPLLAAARAACEAGVSYDQALSAFVDNGPRASVDETLDPVRAALLELDAALSAAMGESGAEQLAAAVAAYQKANEGLAVLYTEGETAYQSGKASGRDADVLQDSAEEDWTAAAEALFGPEAPSPPSDFMREC